MPTVERVARLPAGFVAAAGTAGIKASGRPALALIAATSGPIPAAAVTTPNAFAAAPVRLSRAHLARTYPAGSGGFGFARAIVSTSGCANAATGPAGDDDQRAVAEAVARALDAPVEEVLCLSTGVIGTRLPVDAVRAGIAALVPSIAGSDEALESAAIALMTTDTRAKVASAAVDLPGPDGAPCTVRVSGIAKGVGMIHPRMATMLAVLLTDADVGPETLAAMLRGSAARTWDQLTIDGDTSTNDTVLLLASGAAAAARVHPGTPAAAALAEVIEAVARDLARQQAADGEGATTLVTCAVTGAVDDAEARAVARAVAGSSLVKAAVHGRDPNWGRIAGAAGNARLADAPVLVAAGLDAAEAERRAGRAAALDPDRLRVRIAGHPVYDGSAGGPIHFDRGAARAAMESTEVVIELDLGLGPGTGEAFGCDLTETYVTENSEYTT